MKVRTRIAPSPTGFVHIGTIYNALFAHGLAKHYNGDFILRIEDTDQKRFVEGAMEELYEMLREFGLTPDEGPEQGGPYTPYIQSERIAMGVYMDAAKSMVDKGDAYYCFLTAEELTKIKEQTAHEKVRKAFRSPYRNSSKEEALERINKGEKFVIRLKVPENETISVEDAILGKIEWNSSEVDDQVLIKSDGFPTYHLGVVVDDVAMMITHITRGYEWLPSTPKHVLIYKSLGHELPIFAHSGLVLDPEGGKLSKRKGNVSAKQFLIDGYLVSAMINFMMLMSWSPPIERVHGEKEREIFSHEEFIRMYELKDRNKNNAVFDRNKLLWFNQQYMMKYTPAELTEVFLNWLSKYGKQKEYENIDINKIASKIEERGKEFLTKCIELEQTRVKLLSDLPESLELFYFEPANLNQESVKQLKKLTAEEFKKIVAGFLSRMDNLDADSSKWSHEEWEKLIRDMADEMGIKAGQAFMSLRYAVTGKEVSPPLFEIMQIINTDEIKTRLNNVLK